MSPQTKKQIKEVIADSVSEIFKTMFDVDIKNIDSCEAEFDDDDLVSRVDLREGDVEIILRFAFPRRTLSPLLEKIYDPVIAKHELTMEDSICEISNIVCSELKGFLNKSGANYEMSLPKVDLSFTQCDPEDGNCLNVSFMLEDSTFLVDLLMDKNA